MKPLSDTQKRWLANRFKDQVRFDAPMARHTSFRIGGPAQALAVPESLSELTALITGARKRGMDTLVIGGGTNLLVGDPGIDGLVVIIRCLDDITPGEETSDTVKVRVGAGVPLKRFCRYCLAHGLTGMNFAIGIPGSVGGALAMNAGTARGCMADGLLSITILDGQGACRTLAREALCAEYRRLTWEAPGEAGARGQSGIIVNGEFLLARGDARSLRREARHIMRARIKTQPLGIPSAGCIFKNPPDAPAAGRLIDQAGLKGRRQGGACVSDRHANYIVNTGGATAADVRALMGVIEKNVWDRFQIQLTPEVKIVGD